MRFTAYKEFSAKNEKNWLETFWQPRSFLGSEYIFFPKIHFSKKLPSYSQGSQKILNYLHVVCREVRLLIHQDNMIAFRHTQGEITQKIFERYISNAFSGMINSNMIYDGTK